MMQAVAEQVQSPPSPPAPLPAPAAAPASPATTVQILDMSPSAAAVLHAKEQQREVLGDQMSRLLNRRESVSDQLQSTQIGPSERTALQEHYTTLNGRIIEMEKALQMADAEWAAAAGVPGATTAEVPEFNNGGPPEEAFVVGAVFLGISSVIVAISWARRLWRGGGKVIAQIPSAFENRFTRLEQSLDSVAIEIERVSEGQRFLTRVFAEQSPRPLGAGAAQPVEMQDDRVSESVRRS